MTICRCEADPVVMGAVRFAACFGYSPCGTSNVARRSRYYCGLLKTQHPGFLGYSAQRVADDVRAGGVLAESFASRPTLIPVPSSACAVPGSESSAGALAQALAGAGLGSKVWAGLTRIQPVIRSSRAAPGCRASAQDQYRSLRVEPAPQVIEDILLVDDLITKGRTLIAAASRLREAFPAARIRGFALMRTLSLVPDIEVLMAPCTGEVRWVRGDTLRVP